MLPLLGAGDFIQAGDTDRKEPVFRSVAFVWLSLICYVCRRSGVSTGEDSKGVGVSELSYESVSDTESWSLA